MPDTDAIASAISAAGQTGDWTGVETLCRTALAETPADPQLLFTLGQVLLYGGKTEDCITVIDQVVGLVGPLPQVVMWRDRAAQLLDPVDPALLPPRTASIKAALAAFYEVHGRGTPFPKELLKAILPEAPVIVEAGAFNGDDTREFSGLFPKGRIYSFEPNPYAYQFAARAVDGLTNVTLTNAALADREGSGRLFVSSGGSHQSSSLLRPKKHLEVYPGVDFKSEVEVRLVSLGQFLRRDGVERIDFAWLDLQGYELAVIKTIEDLLPTVTGFFIEIALVEMYENNPLYAEVRDYLLSKGFSVAYHELALGGGGNALFIRG